MGSQPSLVVGEWGGGRSAGGSWDPKASLGPASLPLRMLRNPFFLLSSSFSSSSTESLSTYAMTSLGEWAVDYLSNLSSKSGRWIVCYAFSSLSSLKWNWLISTSSDWREEAVSFLGTVASGRACWRGSLTGERSSQARKPGTETSIQASQRSLALIAWPTSWNVSDRGSKSKIRWTGLQLPVFTHEYLGPQHLVETRNVDKAESRSNVPFIC